MTDINAAGPEPTPSHDGQSVTDMVVHDLSERRKMGVKKYGGELTTNNGRDALIDAYQEVLDLSCYLRQKIEEEAKSQTAGAIREKYWQEKAGEFALIANWALIELLERVEVGSNEHEQANDYFLEIIPFLDFSEEIE